MTTDVEELATRLAWLELRVTEIDHKPGMVKFPNGLTVKYENRCRGSKHKGDRLVVSGKSLDLVKWRDKSFPLCSDCAQLVVDLLVLEPIQ